MEVAAEQLLARAAEHLQRSAVDEHAAALAVLAEDALARRFEQQLEALGHLGALGLGAAAAQNRADAGAQDDRVVRLGEEVLRAHFDRPHHVGLVVERGEDDHRDVLQLDAALHRGEHLEAVDPRHEDVEQDEVEALAVEARQGGGAVGLDGGVVPLALQAAGEDLAVVGVVVDHQDSGSAAARARDRSRARAAGR